MLFRSIGKVIYLSIPDQFIDSAGELDLALAESTGISGLNTYYSLEKIGQYPYARLSDLAQWTPQNSNYEDFDPHSETPLK